MNGDTVGVHTTGKDEIPTLIFGSLNLDRPWESRSGQMVNTIEGRSYHFSTKLERITTVQASSDAAAGKKSEACSTVVKSTVRG